MLEHVNVLGVLFQERNLEVTLNCKFQHVRYKTSIKDREETLLGVLYTSLVEVFQCTGAHFG